MTTNYLELQFPTKEGISLHDITPQLRQVLLTTLFCVVCYVLMGLIGWLN